MYTILSIQINNTSCPISTSPILPRQPKNCVTWTSPVCLIPIRRNKKRYKFVPGSQRPEIGLYQYIGCHPHPVYGIHDGRNCQSNGGQGKNARHRECVPNTRLSIIEAPGREAGHRGRWGDAAERKRSVRGEFFFAADVYALMGSCP